MQLVPDKARRPVLYGLLTVALVGSGSLVVPNCTEIQVKDLETGLLRPATPEEAAQVITEAGEVAKLALTATGHPEWYPFADIGVRLAVLIYAIRFGQPIKPKPGAPPTEGSP